MAGKKRLRMRGVKHSSKRLEDDLLDRARTLADNPGLLRPQCAGNCRKCVFDKTFKNIDSLQKIRNSKDALMTSSGPMPEPYPWPPKGPSLCSPVVHSEGRRSPTPCAEPWRRLT